MSKQVLFFIILWSTHALFSLAIAQSNDKCMSCHSMQDFTIKRNGEEVSLHVDIKKFNDSKHQILACIDCHVGFDPQAFPHKEGDKIYKVDCSMCHFTEDFQASVHSGKVDCYECHSNHAVQPATELKKNVQTLCTQCHQLPDINKYKHSVHFKFSKTDEGATCIGCHDKSAHKIKPITGSKEETNRLCSGCHDSPNAKYHRSLHYEALEKNLYLAPNCISCHGSHGVLPSSNEEAKTYVMNIPSLCGECHKEGTQVSELKEIDKHHVMEDYSQSIHGDGLFQRGLTVTAVCTNCHNSHDILHSEDPESSINKENIPKTCMRCHAQIEKVHKKIIRGELWEKKPDAIPVCVDCHEPHKVRRVFYNENFPDESCMFCHRKDDIYKIEDGKKINLTMDKSHIEQSAHSDQTCIKCHTDVSNTKSPVCKNSGKVDCSICHSEEVENYKMSKHGQLTARDKEVAPGCTDCHGEHKILAKDNPEAPIFTLNIPNLCGKCHKKGTAAARISSTIKKEIVKNYKMSIHGKGLMKSGLMVTATCVDCHTNHRELPSENPNSTVNPDNVNQTCSKCHLGVSKSFKKSVHSPQMTDTEKALPKCNDCHLSHSISRVDQTDFRQKTIFQCGKCHEKVTETYFDTFHGKVSKLGSGRTAKCFDCHGSHSILPPENPESTLSRQNIIGTCKQCHPNANRKFTGYLTHATHHNKEKYTVLYYTYLFMTTLLISVFIFFGLHTLLWLMRGLVENRKKKKGVRKNAEHGTTKYKKQ